MVTAGLALSACGSDSLSGDAGGTSSSSSSSSSGAVNDELAAKVPAKIKDKGTITIGVDASYAPNEFLDTDGKTVKGFDVDLFNAVAGQFGLKTEWVPANFDSIIVGVQSGKYDVGVSSFTINDKR
jgi:polar amino acid transport system substrate-binding protein